MSVEGTARALYPNGEIMHDAKAVPGWLPELVDQVRAAFEKLGEGRDEQRPALEHEVRQIRSQERGWAESLANPDLSSPVRAALETEWAAAIERRQQIEGNLAENQNREEEVDRLVEPQQVLERLERLADVLGSNNPTMGNLELSLHIDRIDCRQDGAVNMRMCKLGMLTEAIGLLAEPAMVADGEPTIDDRNGKRARKPRRRGRLRTHDSDHDGVDMRALADFVADTERFAGLGDEWFWQDDFQIPGPPPSWAAKYAERVFQRRQQGNLSYAKLAREFGVTSQTTRAAVNHYLAEHPDATDQVRLRPCGKRTPKVDVSKFATEARDLWNSGWSKLKLAEKYGYSAQVIDGALAFAYAQSGLSAPSNWDRREERVAKAREMLDKGAKLAEIAVALKISDITVRKYLRGS